MAFLLAGGIAYPVERFSVTGTGDSMVGTLSFSEIEIETISALPFVECPKCGRELERPEQLHPCASLCPPRRER